MSRILFTFFIFFFCAKVIAQKNAAIDSLTNCLKKTQHDSIRIGTMLKLAENHQNSKGDSTLAIVNRVILLCDKNIDASKNVRVFSILKGRAVTGRGVYYDKKGKFTLAEQDYLSAIKLFDANNKVSYTAYPYKKLSIIYRVDGKLKDAERTIFKALEIYEKGNIKDDMASVYLNVGDLKREMSLNAEAMEWYNKSIKLKTEIGDMKGVSVAYNNIAYMLNRKGDIKSALDYYFKALKIREDLKDKIGASNTYINIGDISFKQGDTSRAMGYFKKALANGNEAKDKKTIAGALIYIGYAYQQNKDHKKGIEIIERALKIREEINDKTGMAYCYFNISKSQVELGDTAGANQNFQKAFQIWRSINDKRGISSSLNYMAEKYLEKGDLTNALNYGLRADKTADESKIADQKKQAATTLSKIYLAMGNYQDAYAMYNTSVKMKDSLQNEQNKKSALEKDLQHEYEKKEARIQAEKERQQAVFTTELRRKQLVFELGAERESNKHKLEKKELTYKEELKRKQLSVNYQKNAEISRIKNEKEKALAGERDKRQRVIIGIVSVGLLMVAAFLIILFNRFKTIKKQKTIIEEQKSRVEAQNKEIHLQKVIVEEKQKEIIDSINYAKRLQQAILATPAEISKYFSQNFLFYKPKDIVAGDFYFFETTNTHVFYAAADCTGHGVPGALVSVVCANALSRCVKEFKLTEPGKILDKTRELVLETFTKSGSDVKDGMDISLVVFEKLDKNNSKVLWSGANNGLWYIENNQMREIAPDKQPVGMTENPKPFTTHKLSIEKASTMFLFTDGFADQFGGDKGKKFKYKNLQQLLLKFTTLNMIEQEMALEKEFEVWRGELEQVDDVCVIGIKI